MSSSKSKCSKCLGRHVPQTGKKCKYLMADDMDELLGHSSIPVSPVKRQSSEKASDVQRFWNSWKGSTQGLITWKMKSLK